MSLDRNKTPLTHSITQLAANWLDGKGFKPVETEVSVGDRWIADIVGVSVSTQTESIDLHLVKRPPRYDYARMRDDEAKREAYNAAYATWNATLAAIPQPLTALIEVKTSVGDYRGDRKWTATPWPTNVCYVAMPENLAMAVKGEWPANWGVILCSQEGTTIRRVIPPARIESSIPVDKQMWTILNLAVARDHVTRYARFREISKAQRVEDGERTTISRVADAIRLVNSIMGGKTVEDALRYHGIKAKLPADVVADLEKLKPMTMDGFNGDELREELL